MIKDKVDQQVLEDLKKVRDSGEVNMFNRRGVQFVANDLNCFSLVCWIEDHRASEYAKLLDQFSEYLEQQDD